MLKSVFVLFWCLFLMGNFVEAGETSWLEPAFSSVEGREREVSFRATFRTNFESLQQLSALTSDQKKLFARDHIDPMLKFLFGPLTQRQLGGPQRGSWIQVDWESAKVADGKVNVEYDYQGIWILDKDVSERFSLPVPYNEKLLFTRSWKKCSDSAPEHQTEWFYWYYWDPERSGCDHREGTQYQTVKVTFGAETLNGQQTYPEYEKLRASTGEENLLRLTFAFGYVEDSYSPNPDTDQDSGMAEYRDFTAAVRRQLGEFRESRILQGEYQGASNPRLAIGRRFTGRLKGVDVVINVVTAAGIDQMDLFAKSFAHDHDGFFGWFGHSRVGSGFDSDRFWKTVVRSPGYYTVTPRYQIIYWGGCNSYSYYTLPFFEFKAHVANGADPNGTKGLDIIANGLPSYFHLNADNAQIMLRNLLDWEAKASYHSIIGEIESRAQRSGIDVLVAVLGDEDNE